MLVLACAIVLVLPTIVHLISGSPGLGTGSSETQSRSYWNTASPISLQNFRFSGNTISLELVNTDVDQIVVTDISIGGSSIVSTPTSFQSGDSKLITGTISTNCGAPGTPYTLNNVVITYSKGTSSGLKQTGTIPLRGKCN